MSALRLGAWHVGELQQKLIEAGETVPDQELTTQVFGPGTRSAVIDFQSHHLDQNGDPLTVDGVVGNMTAWSLDHPHNSTPGHVNGYLSPGWKCAPSESSGPVTRVVEAAFSQIGVHEIPDGSNRGPEVDRYGGAGAPWCAYFVSWCYGHADGGSPFGVLASALSLKEWGVKKNRIVTTPAVGDVFVILRGTTGHGHTGLIADVSADFSGGGKVSTIEGNSANAVRGILRDPSVFNCLVRPLIT